MLFYTNLIFKTKYTDHIINIPHQLSTIPVHALAIRRARDRFLHQSSG